MSELSLERRKRKVVEWIRGEHVRGRTTPYDPIEAQALGFGELAEVVAAMLSLVGDGTLTARVQAICGNQHNVGEWEVTEKGEVQLPFECESCPEDDSSPREDWRLFFSFWPSADWASELREAPDPHPGGVRRRPPPTALSRTALIYRPCAHKASPSLMLQVTSTFFTAM